MREGTGYVVSSKLLSGSKERWEERMSSAAWPGKRLVNQLKLDNSLLTLPQSHIMEAD